MKQPDTPLSAAANPQIDLAARYVHDTHRHVFLTGRAGTGKSTLLKRLLAETDKRAVVVAPTGVAAVNVGGHTIHSIFQLPFGLLAPGTTLGRMRKLSTKKAKLLRGLDLLIIDEISMVRPDVLDAMDEVLRAYRNDPQPFGGVQLLMIGDLFQLPPVLLRKEEYDFSIHYPTPYFFSSQALGRTDYRIIELETVYRQRDPTFLALLNATRDRQLDGEHLTALNERFVAGASADGQDGGVVLCSHRRMAARINRTALQKLPGPPYRIKALITGKFPESQYPNDLELELKVGAQVMFNKNDPNGEYYNGLVSTIVRFDAEENLIYVRLPHRQRLLAVGLATWEYNDPGGPAEERGKPRGTYSQHPLRLAWAITIHKSQGLTFDRVVIDAADCFAHGQAYVALSRCRTLKGITLRSRLRPKSVRTDDRVRDFTKSSEDRRGTLADLAIARHACSLDCLRKVYTVGPLRHAAAHLLILLKQHAGTLRGRPAERWEQTGLAAIAGAHPLSQRALSLLDELDPAGFDDHRRMELLAQLTDLNRTLAKATAEVSDAVLRFQFTTRNQRTESALDQQYALVKEIFQRRHFLLLAFESPFDPRAYYRLKAGWGRREREAPRADRRALELRLMRARVG